MTDVRTNWARNVRYGAASHSQPISLDELRATLSSADRIKVQGSGHSFNRIADTGGVSISLDRMPAEVTIDAERGVATVPAGLRYGDIVQTLDEAGYALANLASLPHISIAGAVATGTHGSGNAVPPLSGAVAAVTLMTSDGDLVTVRRGDADFGGAVVSLGALGVVISLELDLVERFEVAQTVYPGVPLDDVLGSLDEVTALGYSTSLFLNWRDPDCVDRVWVKRRADDANALPSELFGVAAATESLHPVPGLDAHACAPQCGVTGPWYERLPHFLLAFTPSVGDELQSEYFVARRHAADALRALRALAPQLAPLLIVNEVRTMTGDDQWLSPTAGADAVALHFTWIADQPRIEAFLPVLEAALAPFDARPHWGKLFATPPERIADLYPRIADFAALRSRLDPRGVFGNDFLDAVLPSERSPRGRDRRRGGPGGRPRGVQRVFEVIRTERISQQLVRVHLGGDAFDGFIETADPANLARTDKYVKFLFAKPELGLTPPYDLDALRETLAREDLPVRRTYTVRSIDHEARTITVDFVVHGDEGLAGPWAARAHPGDSVVLSGPGGGYSPASGDVTHLFFADDSAIPAVAAAIDALPPTARGLVVIEVAGDDAHVDLGAPGGVEVVWLHRGSGADAAPYGELLVEAVASLERPNGEMDVFAHAERGAIKRIGTILNIEWGIPRQAMSLSAYWAYGRTEDAFQGEKRAPIGQIFAD